MSTKPVLTSDPRSQIEARAERLRAARASGDIDPAIDDLVGAVDGALDRLAAGTFGSCAACHDPIEDERLATDPTTRFCLGCLTEPQRRALEDDLGRAAAIQDALLPPRRLQVPGWEVHYAYRPAGPVSGDFCDLVPPSSGGGDTWFLLGDVSGKGVAASLLMSNLHAIFRALLGNGTPPEDVVRAAGRMFAASTLPGHYATLVCGRASADGRVDLVSAGQCPPLLLRQDTVEELPLRGLPVGLFEEGCYCRYSVRLERGDSLVLYTDGLTEAVGADGGAYGTARVVETLERSRGRRAEDITRACILGAETFRAADTDRDDLTVMTLQRGAPAGATA